MELLLHLRLPIPRSSGTCVWGGGHAGLRDVHPPTGLAVTWSAVTGNVEVVESLQARFASRLNDIVLCPVPERRNTDTELNTLFYQNNQDWGLNGKTRADGENIQRIISQHQHWFTPRAKGLLLFELR